MKDKPEPYERLQDDPLADEAAAAEDAGLALLLAQANSSDEPPRSPLPATEKRSV